jgi:chemotaxis protein methyltransferase CheR
MYNRSVFTNVLNEKWNDSFVKLSENEFNRLKVFIEEQTGIKISPAKKILLETRLNKRLKALGLRSFGEYFKYVFEQKNNDEIINLINHVTTNKTDFFRESSHFDYLKSTILPKLVEKYSKILIWSSACSTGEEPYTIAFVVKDFLERHKLNAQVEILASDISTNVLQKAVIAIYPLDVISQIPNEYYKYLMRHKNREVNQIRVCSEIRGMVKFKRINLLDDFSFGERFHIIFCRNVMIYFDKPTKEKILRNFKKVLVEDGYLFMGQAESLHGLNTEFEKIYNSVYRQKKI